MRFIYVKQIKTIHHIVLFCSFFTIIGCFNKDNKLEKAEDFISIKRYDLALKVADEAMMETPKNPEVHLLKGKILLYSDEYSKAEESFKTAIMISNKYIDKTGYAYLEVAMELMEDRENNSEYSIEKLLNKAKMYNPDLSSTITKEFIDKVYIILDSVPDINKNLFQLIDYALKYSGASTLEDTKNEISSKLTQYATERYEKRLYRSVIFICFYINKIDPLKVQTVVELLLKVYFQIVENELTDIYSHTQLASNLVTLSPKVEENPKFVYYSIIKTGKSKDVKLLREFLNNNSTQSFAPDVCFKLINVLIMELDFKSAKKFIEYFKNNFATNSLMQKVLEKEKELSEF